MTKRCPVCGKDTPELSAALAELTNSLPDPVAAARVGAKIDALGDRFGRLPIAEWHEWIDSLPFDEFLELLRMNEDGKVLTAELTRRQDT